MYDADPPAQQERVQTTEPLVPINTRTVSAAGDKLVSLPLEANSGASLAVVWET